MVLKLYGSAKSTCTRRVAVILHEKKVPFELVPVDYAAGEHKSEAYLKKQPFGQVPYLDDDGFILFESRAIGHYIASKYPDQGTPLIPSGLQANALFQQALSIEVADFDDYASKAAKESVFKAMQGLKTDQAVLDELLKTLDAKLDGYERILNKQKYLAGDEISLADLFHLPYGSMLPASNFKGLEARPNVARWWKDVSTRPSWQAVKDGASSTA
ncbi:glutathione S-transferase [Crepidotus variabilis]|uniref:glutathione transferase n=1 Tax=Crepidotus variabilis TaxID=179855 RepID=A0A9P6EKV4_9AGAR|nr:glutathione S-transferase [Crepidotus variabilis]